MVEISLKSSDLIYLSVSLFEVILMLLLVIFVVMVKVLVVIIN